MKEKRFWLLTPGAEPPPAATVRGPGLRRGPGAPGSRRSAWPEERFFPCTAGTPAAEPPRQRGQGGWRRGGEVGSASPPMGGTAGPAPSCRGAHAVERGCSFPPSRRLAAARDPGCPYARHLRRAVLSKLAGTNLQETGVTSPLQTRYTLLAVSNSPV